MSKFAYIYELNGLRYLPEDVVFASICRLEKTGPGRKDYSVKCISSAWSIERSANDEVTIGLNGFANMVKLFDMPAEEAEELHEAMEEASKAAIKLGVIDERK